MGAKFVYMYILVTMPIDFYRKPCYTEKAPPCGRAYFSNTILHDVVEMYRIKAIYRAFFAQGCTIRLVGRNVAYGSDNVPALIHGGDAVGDVWSDVNVISFLFER